MIIKTRHAFFVAFLFPVCLLGGFSANTMVHVPRGYTAIQDLRVGDLVSGINQNGKLTTTYVSHTTIQRNKEHIMLFVDGQKIVVARSQKFFRVDTNKWVKAKNLKIGDTIRIARSPGVASITDIKEYSHGITLYDIRLEDDHVFCVSDLAIVVHNCGIFVVGLVWTFNVLADIAFEKIVLSFALPFVCAAYSLFFDENKPMKSQLDVQVGSSKITKAVHHNDPLISCGSSNNIVHTPNNQPCCPTYSLDYPVDIRSCAVKSYVDASILVDTRALSDQASQPEGTCNYQVHAIYEHSDGANCQNAYNDLCEQKSSKPSGGDGKTIKRHVIKESEHEAGKECNPGLCNPPPKGPYGYFIPSEKHRAQANGNASAGPTWEEGQRALDQSVPVYDRNRNITSRVVVWDGKFLVFEPTNNGVWHAHYRPWYNQGSGNQALDDLQKNALYEAEMANIKNGKINKDMKNETN